jgi:branched-chain amino acid aminotransferase
MRFEVVYTEAEIQEGFFEAVKANDYKEDVEVRLNVFLDGYGSWYSFGPTGIFIAPSPKGRVYKDLEGIHCCVSSWERINDRSLSPRIKMGANYMNSRLAQLEAVQNGYDTAIFLNDLGKVSEAPGSCIFIIRNGDLLTPPLTASILESITRAAVIELAETELKLKVIERDIDRTELYIADESFLCGTAMEIVSILSVDRFELNQGKPGLISQKLRQVFFDISRGKNNRYLNWLTPVYK